MTVTPDRRHHVFRSDFASLVQDDLQVTTDLLCHQLRIIGAFWHKVRLTQPVEAEGDSGFAVASLERCIRHGSELAAHFLRVYAPPA